MTRLSNPGLDVFPVWSPSGDRIAFSSTRSGGRGLNIFLRAANGRGSIELLLDGPYNDAFNRVTDWSHDGQYLAYYVQGVPDTYSDLWALPLTGERVPVSVLETSFDKFNPVLSPNGQYIAYMSNESERWEVYVIPFLNSDDKWSVSVNGGVFPKWNGQGTELFYVEENTLMVVEVDTRSDFTFGDPQVLFTGEQVGVRLYDGGDAIFSLYDVTADGQRFAVVRSEGGNIAPRITVVENWYAEFKDKEP